MLPQPPRKAPKEGAALCWVQLPDTRLEQVFYTRAPSVASEFQVSPAAALSSHDVVRASSPDRCRRERHQRPQQVAQRTQAQEQDERGKVGHDEHLEGPGRWGSERVEQRWCVLGLCVRAHVCVYV